MTDKIGWGASLPGTLLKQWNLPGDTLVVFGITIGYLKDCSLTSAIGYQLPASHRAYTVQAWNEAHPGEEPFVPWCGGDKAPGDWDGGAALLSDPVGEFKPYNGSAWTKEPRHFRPVIGYRRRKEPVAVTEEQSKTLHDALLSSMDFSTHPDFGKKVEMVRAADLRDQIAMAALQSFCSQCDSDGKWSWLARDAAEQAYEVADAMMEERERRA